MSTSLSKALLPELDHEMANTRRVLERFPEGRADWKPHPKSMSLGRLATHIAELPGWVARILQGESFDIARPGGPGSQGYTPRILESRQAILDLFDASVTEARAALEAAEDGPMMERWSLLRGGQPVFTLPRVAVWRSMLLSHSIHHRGQLTVYLRLNDQPLPSLYGPSADEQM